LPPAGPLDRLDDGLYMTGGGLETTLIFREGYELPLFAAHQLLRTEDGTAVLRRHFEESARLARELGVGLVLQSPTWRASARWGAELGQSPEDLAALNRAAVALVEDLRARFETPASPMILSASVGPAGDAYRPEGRLDAADAERYHSVQLATLRDTAVDMAMAMTMTYADEAIGITRAAARLGLPVAVSFTLETDGRLPGGDPLAEAVERVDEATGGAPLHYMVNCVHPAHLAPVLSAGGAWRERVRGVRVNASAKSHAELDGAAELDEGDPADLAERCAALREALPGLRMLGGCCGTDARHVRAIVEGWRAAGA
jgi:homocysteine S-methyltransferase